MGQEVEGLMTSMDDSSFAIGGVLEAFPLTFAFDVGRDSGTRNRWPDW